MFVAGKEVFGQYRCSSPSTCVTAKPTAIVQIHASDIMLIIGLNSEYIMPWEMVWMKRQELLDCLQNMDHNCGHKLARADQGPWKV